MKKNLIVYANGQQIYTEGGLTLAPHGVSAVKKIDVSEATPAERALIEANPLHSDAVVANIKRRSGQV